MEMRIPWAMLGMSDPSTRSALVVGANGSTATVTIDDLAITVGVGQRRAAEVSYRWEPWRTVQWTERLKPGVEEIQSSFRDATRLGYRPAD